jgi:plasmid stabilization system protein ParE
LPRRTLTVDPRALDALNDAKARLIDQHGAGPRARERYRALAAGVRGLVEHPCRYRPNPEQPGTRVLSISGYRVVYEVLPDTNDDATAGDVRILVIRHPGEP